MKGFDYELENVLKLRIEKEDNRLFDFARAKQNYDKKLESLKCIEGEIGEMQELCSDIELKRIDCIKSHYYYLENLRFKQEKSHDLASEAGKACELKRQAYQNAQVKRKTIETHKEKQRSAYDMEQKKKEERMLDEMAVTAFKRKRGL